MTGFRDLEFEAFGLALHHALPRPARPVHLTVSGCRCRMDRVTWWCRVERLRLLRLWRGGERDYMAHTPVFRDRALERCECGCTEQDEEIVDGRCATCRAVGQPRTKQLLLSAGRSLNG